MERAHFLPAAPKDYFYIRLSTFGGWINARESPEESLMHRKGNGDSHLRYSTAQRPPLRVLNRRFDNPGIRCILDTDVKNGRSGIGVSRIVPSLDSPMMRANGKERTEKSERGDP